MKTMKDPELLAEAKNNFSILLPVAVRSLRHLLRKLSRNLRRLWSG